MSVDKELGDTLPTYLTRFVGRDREIATVLSLLLPGGLSLSAGVGGAGQDSAGYRGGKGAGRIRAPVHNAREMYWVPLAWSSSRPKWRRLWLRELAFWVRAVIDHSHP